MLTTIIICILRGILITMTYFSCSLKDTVSFAQSFAKTLCGNDFIALYGGMGMGKTAFVSGLAKGLCIDTVVSSPTFALVHEYNGAKTLYHFDMYRVTTWEDLQSTGFFDYLDNGVIACEWSENIEEAIPKNHIKISISPAGCEQSRLIEITYSNSHKTDVF